MNIYILTISIITYLICSFNPAIELCKRKTGEDIRKLGSGNAGTANVMRVLGKSLGILVIIIDIAKVFLSFGIITTIGKIFSQDIDFTLKSTFIIASVLGHCFPIYYKFKGGKGVIVGITVGVILNKEVAMVCIITSLLIILITRFVALGTVSGVILYVIMSLVMMTEYLIPVLIVCGIIMYKHRLSIQRLLSKQEEKFW